MATLLSLSTELLIAIYSSSTTIQSAASLSSTDKRLRAIWLEHTDHIIAGILKARIPAFDNAVDLAILEEIWTDKDSTQAASPASKEIPTPLRKCLPRLLHNADLASSATAAWKVDLATIPPDHYLRRVSPTASHHSYYLMRKLLLARRNPKANLLRPLYLLLRTLSREVVQTYERFCSFLLGGNADHEVQLPHNIRKPEEEWTEADEFEDEHNGIVLRDDWSWVGDVLDTAMMDDYHGRKNLEGLVLGMPERRSSDHIRQYGWV